MGKFVKYAGGYLQESLFTANPDLSRTWVTTDLSITRPIHKINNSHAATKMYVDCGGDKDAMLKMTVPFFRMTPYATNDVFNNYSVDDYAVNNVTDISVLSSMQQNKGNLVSGLTYIITLSNNGSSEKVVSCIKFVGKMGLMVNDSGNVLDVLLYGYFLDNPITIGAGQTETIAITFAPKFEIDVV